MITAKNLEKKLRRHFVYEAMHTLRDLLREPNLELKNVEPVVAVLQRSVSMFRTVLEELMRELEIQLNKQELQIQDEYWNKKTNAEQVALIHRIAYLKEKQEALEILLSDDILQEILNLRETARRFALKMQSSEGE